MDEKDVYERFKNLSEPAVKLAKKGKRRQLSFWKK